MTKDNVVPFDFTSSKSQAQGIDVSNAQMPLSELPATPEMKSATASSSDASPFTETERQNMAQATKEKQDNLAELFSQAKKLGDFADPIPDNENPNAIFKDKYLRRGQLLVFVSTLGAGKSAFVSQGSECWARGLPFMDIAPALPLRIAIFETEDDADEIADFRNNFRKGFTKDGWTDQDIREAESGKFAPVYYPTNHRCGESFINLVSYVAQNAPFDLIVINPFYDFVEGDMSKATDVKNFLSKLMRIAEKYKFAVLIVHHTNKVPSNSADREKWLTADAAAYSGSGSMVLPATARAVIFMRPLKVNGYYELMAAKRGKRLGWTDADGNPTETKYIAHSDGYIYWREPSFEEMVKIKAIADAGGTKTPKKKDHDSQVVEACTDNGKPFISKNSLYAAMANKFDINDSTARSWADHAIKSGKVIERENGDANNSKSIGLPNQF